MIMTSLSTRQFLAEELARRQTQNPRYSMRAFARHLGMSPGELSEILTAKRRLSLKSAIKVGRSLGLNPDELKKLFELCQIEKSEDYGARELLDVPQSQKSVQEMGIDIFQIVSDWYCFAVLNLFDTVDFHWDAQWISHRLGISVHEARVAMERLIRTKLVEQQGNRWVVKKDEVLTSDGIPSEAIRNYHRQILRKALEALDFQKVQERQITGVGFAVDPRHIPALRKDILQFLDLLVEKYKKGKKTEVYQIEVALFRLTEGGSNA